MGGVAKVHGLLIDHWLNHPGSHDIYLAGVVAPNRPSLRHDDSDGPVPFVGLPEKSSQQRDRYVRALEERDVDAVLFFHIGHRFVDWHIKHAARTPAIGAIHSWTQVLTADDAIRQAKCEKLQLHLSQVKWLVAPSEHVFQQGRALGFEYASPCDTIYNPVDPKITVVVQNGQVRCHERRGIAFVGALNDIKRPQFVIQAAAAVGLPLVIVGDGPQRTELERLAEKVNANTTIKFKGQETPQRIAELLMSSQMLCVPSTSEGLANVYWEALACGTPIVGFAPNVLELTRVLGVPVGEPVSGDAALSAVIDAIARVKGTSWNHEELKKRVANCNTVTMSARRYAEVIKKAVAAYRGSGSEMVK